LLVDSKIPQTSDLVDPIFTSNNFITMALTHDYMEDLVRATKNVRNTLLAVILTQPDPQAASAIAAGSPVTLRAINIFSSTVRYLLFEFRWAISLFGCTCIARYGPRLS
jgi:hypothetical protein